MIVLKCDDYQHDSRFLNLAINGMVATATLYQANQGVDLSGDFDISNYSEVNRQSFDLSQIYQPYTTFGILLDKFGKLMSIYNFSEISNSRNGLAAICHLQYGTEQRVISLHFQDSVSDYVLISYLPTQTSAKYTLRSKNESTQDVVVSYYPKAAKLHKISEARHNLLLGVDPNKSLSAVEQQLDLLTDLVFLLVSKQPDNLKQAISTAFPQLSSFQAVCNDNSSTKVKSIDNCIAKIGSVKAQVRQLQKAYHDAVAQNPLS